MSDLDIEHLVDTANVISEHGTLGGWIKPWIIHEARESIISKERAPRWMFVRPNKYGDMLEQDEIRRVIVTEEHIMRNPHIRDFREAVEFFNERTHERTSAELYGMQVIETEHVLNHDVDAMIMPTHPKRDRPDNSIAATIEF